MRTAISQSLFAAAVLSLGAAAMLAAGCVEPPFSAHVPDNVVADIQRTMAQSQAGLAGARTRPVAYVVTSGDKHLVSFDLDAGKVLWDVAADVTSRVAVGRGFIAAREGGSIIVRDAADGHRRCAIAIGGSERLLGIAADDRVYYTIEPPADPKAAPTGTRKHHLAAADPSSCAELWRDEANGSLGAPAARGGVVAAPYLHQDVVLLDGATGKELGRVRSLDDDVSFVRATREGFAYGSNNGVYLLGERSAKGTRKDAGLTSVRMVSDQVKASYFWDAYQPAQLDYTAFDKNRLLWRLDPADGGGGKLREGMAYLHNYKFLFGLDAATGDVRWAYGHPRVDLVSSEDAGPSILFASTDGEFGVLDAKTGALRATKKSGLKVAGVTFDADGYAPAADAAPPPLIKALAQVVWDPDARFTRVKVFVVEAMARISGQEVTAELLRIVLKVGMAPQITQKAAEALIARKDAASVALFREALATHYNYLDDVQARAIDVLARVTAAIDDKESVPLLGTHLVDPATPVPQLREIVRSMLALGGKEAIAPLRNLLLTYRCDAAFVADPTALQLAGAGLLKLGGPEERRLVSFVADEPRTIAPVAAVLRRALAGESLEKIEAASRRAEAASKNADVATPKKMDAPVVKPATTTAK